MGRSISPELQSSIDASSSTLTLILQVVPAREGYSPYGASGTNADIFYDAQDGLGNIKYNAIIGMIPSDQISNLGLSVNNADFQHLLPEFDVPISEDDIRAGVYDYAKFTLMLVDYENLSYGHVVIHHGSLGKLRINDGLSFFNELFGLSKSLKQSLCERYSRTCPAIFGSQPIGTGGGVVEERRPCGYNAEALFDAFEVTNVGDDPSNTFTDVLLPFSSVGPETDYYARGMIRWISGLNAGREYEVEGNTIGGSVTTQFSMDYPAQIGDQGLIRQGCSKQARDSSRGCAHWFGSEWTIHFRGQPDIPLGDALANSVPGGNSGPGNFGGVTGIVESAEE